MDLDRIKRDGEDVLLSFSCGKDSLCAWLVLRAAGFRVYPFYMQLVPGLAFVERSLRYYEEFFETPILRVLHPNLYADIDIFRGQPPSRQDGIESLRLPIFSYADVEAGVRRTCGLGDSTWVAVGLRYADSSMRRNRMPKDGINYAKRRFYPIAPFKKNDLIAALQQAKVKLPPDYLLFARSFDGLDYRFLSVIKERFPTDYALIREWFPLAEVELFRAEVARRHGQAQEPHRSHPAACRRRPVEA